jgi:uncharacterized membrane protein
MGERQRPDQAQASTVTAPTVVAPGWSELPEEVRVRLAPQLGAGQQSMPESARPAVSPRTRAFILRVDRAVLAVARHWVLTVNLIGGIYAGLPLLAPWLLARGIIFPANVIYFFYGLTCHQMPGRSFYVFGNKMCYCQRCCAIYSGVFFFGLLFPLVARWVRPLRWRWMFFLWVPMALDGFTQLFGLRESNWELRVFTGTLFALSCVWVVFPHLARAFTEMRRDLENRLRRDVLEAIPASR